MEPFEFQPHCAGANIECRRANSHGAELAEFTPRTQRIAQYARFALGFLKFALNNDARKIASRFAIELARTGFADVSVSRAISIRRRMASERDPADSCFAQ